MQEMLDTYELKGELGRGGMGVVYKAWDPKLERHVAIKVMLESLSSDAKTVNRFLREARNAAGLEHGSVVRVYDSGTWKGCPYFVMEFVEGETLSQLIQRAGALSPHRAAVFLQAAAEGLAVAHDRGIIHRDIKPANLLLDPQGKLRIADFGIALALRDEPKLTGTGQYLGTPGYLSPEVCLGEPLDARSDIFSLGIVFYEMLTGTQPFQGHSPLMMMKQVAEARIPDHLRLRDLDDALRELLAKMLAPKPMDRIQDCHQLALALGAYLQPYQSVSAVTRPDVAPHQATMVIPDTEPEPVAVEVLSPKRRPWIKALVAAILVVAIVLAVGWQLPEDEMKTSGQQEIPVDQAAVVALDAQAESSVQPLPNESKEAESVPEGLDAIPEPTNTEEEEGDPYEDVVHMAPDDPEPTPIPKGVEAIPEPMIEVEPALVAEGASLGMSEHLMGTFDVNDVLIYGTGPDVLSGIAVRSVSEMLPPTFQAMDMDLIGSAASHAERVERLKQVKGDVLLLAHLKELGSYQTQLSDREMTVIQAILWVEGFDADGGRLNLNWYTGLTYREDNAADQIRKTLSQIKRPLREALSSEKQGREVAVYAVGDPLLVDPLHLELSKSMGMRGFWIAERESDSNSSKPLGHVLGASEADLLISIRLDHLSEQVLDISGEHRIASQGQLSVKCYEVETKRVLFQTQETIDYSLQNATEEAERWVRSQLGKIIRATRE